ncbi:MAG TPA: hypothetical protein VK747_03025 [Blastocatellia bacterium]|nr:hypothetical protein [Blastocatellia bacterium]
MPDDQIIKLLEEIKQLQEQQLRLSQKSVSDYEEQIKRYEKGVKRGKKAQIGLLVVLVLFFLFIFYTEWFLNANPKPPWMK